MAFQPTGLDPVDWVSKYSQDMQSRNSRADSVVSQVWATVERAKETTINFADYTGVYEDKWFGKIEVFLKENQLWFKAYRSPKLTGPMRFYKPNTFAIQWQYQDMNCDAFAQFSQYEQGKAQRIKMSGISPNIDFSFDFQDLDLQRVKTKNHPPTKAPTK